MYVKLLLTFEELEKHWIVFQFKLDKCFSIFVNKMKKNEFISSVNLKRYPTKNFVVKKLFQTNVISWASFLYLAWVQ